MCKNLGFTCETEYFGLVDCSKDTCSSTTRQYDWINLRNPLGHGTGGQPYSLQFRVKFWVPAHLILQESVRNIFYMQARSDLLEGRLLALDWENAAQLSALLAHADDVKYDARLLRADAAVNIPNLNNGTGNNNVVIATASSIDFALHTTPKETIHKSKKRKLSKQKSVMDTNDYSHQSASIDEEHTDNGTMTMDEHSPLRVYHKYIVRPDETSCNEMPTDLARLIAVEHSKIVKMPAKSAKYWLLEEIFKLPGFGEETFSGIVVASTNVNVPTVTMTPNCTSSHHDGAAERCDISVGPHGLMLSTRDDQTRWVHINIESFWIFRYFSSKINITWSTTIRFGILPCDLFSFNQKEIMTTTNTIQLEWRT